MDQPNLNPILGLQAEMAAASGRLNAMENLQQRMLESQKMMLDAQSALLKETVQQRGTFESIGTHLTRLFEDETATRADVADLKRRVEALEKRQPPGA